MKVNHPGRYRLARQRSSGCLAQDPRPGAGDPAGGVPGPAGSAGPRASRGGRGLLHRNAGRIHLVAEDQRAIAEADDVALTWDLHLLDIRDAFYRLIFTPGTSSAVLPRCPAAFLTISVKLDVTKVALSRRDRDGMVVHLQPSPACEPNPAVKRL